MTKHPILCLFMVSVFTIVTAHPFVHLSAAELWNSNKSSGSKSKSSLYNKKIRSQSSGGLTLYNSRNNNRHARSAGLRNNIQAYKRIKIARERKASRLWETMSPYAVVNRQADTDFALQREYNIRKKLRISMIRAAKDREAGRLASKQRYKEDMREYKEKKRAKKHAAWQKKQRYLDNYYYNTPIKKRKYISHREKPKTGLKKPKRLFNDPND